MQKARQLSVNPDFELRCHSLRRLNPFLGVIQVVEIPSGRASSSNGLVRDIQILTQAPADWGSLNTGNRGKAWSRYGLWPERDGLAHLPLAAHTQDRQLRRDSEYLIEQVRSNLDRLPYALASLPEGTGQKQTNRLTR